MKKKSENTTAGTNPFKNRNKDEVWKELDKYSKPISREEALKRLQALAYKNKD